MRFVSVHIAFRSIDPFIFLLSGSFSLLPVPLSHSFSLSLMHSFSFPSLLLVPFSHSSLSFAYSSTHELPQFPLFLIFLLSLALSPSPSPTLETKTHPDTYTHNWHFLSLCPPSSGIETNLIDFLHLPPLSYLLILLLLQSTLLHP